MELHFYTNFSNIQAILKGAQGIVSTKEGRYAGENMHISVDIEKYVVDTVIGNSKRFAIKMRP